MTGTIVSSSINSGIVLNNGTDNPVLITSAGTIDSPGSYGISASDGVAWTITNDGLVTATGTGGIGIDASANTLGITLSNAGTIGGTGSGNAVLFGSGNDRLILLAGAVFSGTVNGGGGTNTLELASSAGTGTITGLGSTYVNFQAVAVDAGATWNFDNTDTVGSGVVLNNAGTLNGNYFLYLSGGTLSNQSTGVIEGSGVVTSLGDGGSIDNAGLINSSYGVRLAATGTVTNEGTILTTGTFPPSYGVYAKHGGTVTNGSTADTTARIEGYTGIRFVPGVGSSYYGFVSNFGTIIGHGTIYSGIGIGQGGTVTNGASSDSAALIQGGRWGVYVPGGTVTNYGTISATYAGNAAAGIYIGSGTADISNLGSNALIEGYYGIVADYGTVTNAGTIASTQGTNGTAIKFLAGYDRLIVMPGATFIGTVAATNLLDSATIELAGTATDSLTGLGTSFFNFIEVDVDAGAHWSLTGTNTIVAGGSFDVMGSLGVAGSIVNDAGFTLAGGTLSLGNPSYVSGGSSFSFGSGSSDLIFGGAGGGTTVANTISGFASGDTIDLPALAFGPGATATVFGSTLEVVSNGGTVDLTVAGLADGKSYFTTQDGGTGTEIIACFAAGTRIATPHGEVPVEQLRIGDAVRTEAGEAVAIKWIGRRGYSGTVIAANPQLRPVCVHPHALAAGVPARALLLSPAHALRVDDALIPAAALVNGRSITRAEGGVSYFHIELKRHDVLVAEGAPAESFFPTAGRAMFENAAEFAAMHGADALPIASCLPRLEDGPQLEAIRRRLAARAGLPVATALPGRLRGHVERVVSTGDGQHVEGWVLDESAPEQPVELEVTAEDAAPLRLLANRYRSDLDRAALAGGRCGFSVRLPGRGRVMVRRACDGARLSGAA